MQPSIPVFDREGALSRLGGDEDLFKDLVGFFLEDSPALLEAVRQGVEQRDASAVERGAHALKGLVANFGATLAVEAASSLESIGRRGRMDDAPRALERLEKEVEILTQSLRDSVS